MTTSPPISDSSPALRWLREHRAPVALWAITLVGLFFRAFRLQSVPPGLFFDEGMYGVDAVQAMRTGHYAVFYPANFGREGLYINLQCISLALFHLHAPWVLRLQSVVDGTLTLPGVFLLSLEIARLRQERHPTLFAALASGFLALCFWHVALSRIGFSAIGAPLAFVWSSFLLLRALRTGSIPWSIAAGFVFGLGFHTYLAFRVAPLTLLPLIRPMIQANRRAATAAFVLTALATAAPIAIYLLTHPTQASARTSALTLLQSRDPWLELVYNSLLSVTMFYYHGDGNWRHNIGGAPELWLPIAILFALGILSAVRNRNAINGWLLVWLGSGLLPMILVRTEEGVPHALRAILVVPAATILAAAGATMLFEFFETKGPRIERVAACGLALLLAGYAVTTYHDYFLYYAHQRHTRNAFYVRELHDQAVALNRLPSSTIKYVVIHHWSGGGVRQMPPEGQSFLFEVYVSQLIDAPARHIVLVNASDSAAVARIPSGAPRFDID
ncbi:MAG: ArnT family glycosyltransferase [Capsulimonadaceae bacterium]